MPIKWTPVNIQILLWLAWAQNSHNAQNIVDAWPNISEQEAPTKRAVTERIGFIRKGVQEHGVAAYFGNRPSTPKRTRKIINWSNQQPTELAKVDDLDYKFPTTKNGPQSTAKHGGTSGKDEFPNAVIKPEDVDDTTAVDGEQRSQYLATPPKTPGRGSRAVPKNSNNRKRRRPGTDTEDDSASMTTEMSRSEISVPTPDFDMKLHPDHRKVSLFESDGETGSDGSDTAWVPGSDEGRGRRKRVRRH